MLCVILLKLDQLDVASMDNTQLYGSYFLWLFVRCLMWKALFDVLCGRR